LITLEITGLFNSIIISRVKVLFHRHNCVTGYALNWTNLELSEQDKFVPRADFKDSYPFCENSKKLIYYLNLHNNLFLIWEKYKTRTIFLLKMFSTCL